MKYLIANHIRIAVFRILHAAFVANVKKTWTEQGRDPGKFIRIMEPVVQRWEKERRPTSEILQYKKDISEGTDKKVELLSKGTKLEVVPAR